MTNDPKSAAADAPAPDEPAADAKKKPRFVIQPDALVDTKGKGRFAPVPGVTQALADECNANPDRFEHFVYVPGMPPGPPES